MSRFRAIYFLYLSIFARRAPIGRILRAMRASAEREKIVRRSGKMGNAWLFVWRCARVVAQIFAHAPPNEEAPGPTPEGATKKQTPAADQPRGGWHTHTPCSQMRAPPRFHEHEKLDRSFLRDTALECFSRIWTVDPVSLALLSRAPATNDLETVPREKQKHSGEDRNWIFLFLLWTKCCVFGLILGYLTLHVVTTRGKDHLITIKYLVNCKEI